MFELVLISNVFVIVIIFVIVKCFCYKVIVCRIPSMIQGLSLRGDVGYRSCSGNSVFLCPGEVGRLLGQIIPSNGGFISGCYIVWMLNIGSKVWVVWMWESSITGFLFHPENGCNPVFVLRCLTCNAVQELQWDRRDWHFCWDFKRNTYLVKLR